MDQRIAPATYNPWSDAMDHATKMMQIGLQQRQLDQQKQYLDNATQEHQMNMSQKLINSMDAINKTTHPKLRAAMADQLSDGYQKVTGKPLDDGLMAVLKSQEPHDDFSSAMSTLAGAPLDPAVRAKTFPKIIPMLGQEGSVNLVSKLAGDVTTVQAAQLHKEATQNQINATNDRFNRGQTTRDVKAGFGEIDKDLKMPMFQLYAASRINHVIEDAAAGKYKTNAQVLSSLTSEFARMERGTNIIAEGSERKQAVDSIKQDILQTVQRGMGKPMDTVDPDWIKQVSGQIGTMTRSYMTNIDSAHEATRAGLNAIPEAQKAVDAKVNTFRGQMSKPEFFGKWDGPNQNGVPQKKSPSPKQTAPPPADYSPQQLQTAAALMQKMKDPQTSADQKAKIKKALDAIPDSLKEKVGYK